METDNFIIWIIEVDRLESFWLDGIIIVIEGGGYLPGLILTKFFNSIEFFEFFNDQVIFLYEIQIFSVGPEFTLLIFIFICEIHIYIISISSHVFIFICSTQSLFQRSSHWLFFRLGLFFCWRLSWRFFYSFWILLSLFLIAIFFVFLFFFFFFIFFLFFVFLVFFFFFVFCFLYFLLPFFSVRLSIRTSVDVHFYSLYLHHI